MKTLLLYLLTLIAPICSAQIYRSGDIEGKDSCDFMSGCSIVQLDVSAQNIWNIGQPNKLVFTGGKNDSMCLFTDTSLHYKENISSSFQVYATVKNGDYNYLDGNALLSFWHKLNTDTLKDGGFIEISYDSGITWVNVLNDSFNFEAYHADQLGYNMYHSSQKLYNGESGFSGSINEWTYVEIPLIRYILVFTKSHTRIRFNFISDSIPSQKEGWMIDDIKLSHVQLHGGLSQLDKSTNTLSVYPNPCSDQITVTSIQENFNGTLSIFNMEGKMMQTYALPETRSVRVDVNALQEGIYTLLYHDNVKGDFYYKLAK